MSAEVERHCICGDGIICATHARPMLTEFRQTIASLREQNELPMEALASAVKCLQEAAEKTADAVARVDAGARGRT